MHLTRTIVGPILGFLTKLTVFRASSPHVNAPLSKAAFATGERLLKAPVNNSSKMICETGQTYVAVHSRRVDQRNNTESSEKQHR